MTAAMARDTQPVPERDVPVRRVSFDFPPETTPRHYAGHDPLRSHLITLGSAVFPGGEDFFVRTVRVYRDEITDPELRRQVNGFIGQEAMHGRSHRTLNSRLAALGYPIGFVDKVATTALRTAEALLPKDAALAITAALEHYTATLAEVLLSEPELQDEFVDDEIRTLFLWHALEETEHKAVAFDVFQAVSGNPRVRASVMRTTTAVLVVGIAGGLVISMLGDPEGRKPRRLLASLRALRNSPMANRRVLARLRDYNRADFHPDDYDTTDLVAQWRRRLLADDGSLVVQDGDLH